MSRTIARFLTTVVLLGMVTSSMKEARADIPSIPSDLDHVDEYIRSEMEELKIPGLEATIVHNDQVLYAKGFGIADSSGRQVTPQTPMILGSVSKGFTALAILQLVEENKMNLDSPLQNYLPWFALTDNPKMDPPDAWKQITIRNLLNHTSGISNNTGENSWSDSYAGEDAIERQVASFAGDALVHFPGSTFEYSNANYQILGMVIQAVSGTSYENYVHDHIFVPLDMSNSYISVSTAPELATGYRYFFGRPVASPNIPMPRCNGPAALVMSDAEDMGHYLIALMNGGKYGDVQILSAQGLQTMQYSSVDTGQGFEYAMGWAVDPDGTLSHTGETPSFTSGIHIDGEWGVFVVRNIAANQREQRLDEIAPGILSILRGEDPLQNAEDPSFRRILIGLAFLIVLQISGILSTLRTRRKINLTRNMRSAVTTVLLLIVSMMLAMGLWYAGPISNHRSFRVLFQSAPDQLLLLAINVALAMMNVVLQLWRVFHRTNLETA